MLPFNREIVFRALILFIISHFSLILSLQLPDKFPGLSMILQVYATEVPLFSFKPDSLLFDIQISVKALAIQKNGSHVPLFKLGLVSVQVQTKIVLM